jgi:hypothetical protein
MFTWTPGQGVLPCNGGRPVINANDLKPLRVECSSHPQISYISHGDGVLLYDMRRPGAAITIMKMDGNAPQIDFMNDEEDDDGVTASRPKRRTEPSNIQCVKQHATNGDQLLLAHNKTLSVMDVRYARSALTERPTADTHETIRYRSSPSSGRHSGAIHCTKSLSITNFYFKLNS